MRRMMTSLAVLALVPALASAQSLMTPERDQTHRAILPKVASKDLAQKLADPNLLLYSETEIPEAHQDWTNPTLGGVHSRTYNISATKPTEPYGNGNIEFPWGQPFGMHDVKHVASFKFVWLPLDDQGRRRPVVYFRDGAGWDWLFPHGAIVGEVLYMNYQGASYVFEMRTRTRLPDRWSMEVWRPFPTAQDFKKALQRETPTPQLRQAVALLEAPLAPGVWRLNDAHPDRRVFEAAARKDTLPPVDEALVAKLLRETPFQPCTGLTWKEGTDAPAAPASDQAFHLQPKGSTAMFVPVDSTSCMRCHETCNTHVGNYQLFRDWYGRVRGNSEGIFSFHPFAASSISTNGYPQTIRMNPRLEQLGAIAAYDRQRHPPDAYTTIPRRVALRKD